jgi:hypothetical protein
LAVVSVQHLSEISPPHAPGRKSRGLDAGGLSRKQTFFVFPPNRVFDDRLRVLAPMAGPTVVADAERDGHAAGDVAPVSPLAKRDVLVAPNDTAALAEIAVL